MKFQEFKTQLILIGLGSSCELQLIKYTSKFIHVYLEQLHVCMPFIFTTNIHELHDNLNIYLCICGLVSKKCF